METADLAIPEGTKVIHVCDREGDMYELFCKAIVNGWLFLIRVIQNRLTVENGKILDKIRKTAVKGRVTVHIPRDSRRNVKAREVVLMLLCSKYRSRKSLPRIKNCRNQ
jgi:hypothetical protein